MSQGAEALWERVLERDPELKEALSRNGVVESGDDPVNDKPLVDSDTEIADDGPEREIADLLNIDMRFGDDEVEEDVDVLFEKKADLWLSRSRLALEHALLSMGLTMENPPTNRPLLIFFSHRSKLAVPEYYRVEVTSDGWPRHLQSTKPLTSNAAADILASSPSISPCFEGETVAVAVPNPLLAHDRWIVLWPELKDLPDPAEFQQWRQVRRVVWCVDKEQIGPRDVIHWLSNSWPDIPIRIALFRAASFVDEEKDTEAKLKKLSRVRRSLEKFDRIKSHPWIVVGP